MKTNVELKQDVFDEIGFTTGINSERIDVSVNDDGIVTLMGEVQNYPQKLVMARAAKRVSGTREVANDLLVHLNKWALRSDSELAEAAINAILWITNVSAENLKVTVREGWVDLDGVVQSACDKNAIDDTVKALTGVRGVTSRLRVESH